MGTADVYATEVYNRLNLYPTWPPGDFEIGLGAYGELAGNLFRYLGNVKDDGFNLTFDTEEAPHADATWYFATQGCSGPQLQGGLSLPSEIPVAVDLKIEFSKENAIFFNVVGCRKQTIKGKTELCRELQKNMNWNHEWVLVQSVWKAQAATIIISQGKKASCGLSAEIKDLLETKIALDFKINFPNSVFVVENKEGMIPLMSLLWVRVPEPHVALRITEVAAVEGGKRLMIMAPTVWAREMNVAAVLDEALPYVELGREPEIISDHFRH